MARPQINIRVDEGRKKRWKQAAEESPEYDGLSHLIRLAVEQELAEGGGGSDTGSQATLDEGSTDLLREVKGSTDRVEGGIEDVKARLRRLEERVGQTGPKFSLKAAVRETLNTRPEGEIVDGPDGPTELEPTESPEEYGLTLTQVAARLNADESEVEEALNTLEQEGEIRSLGGSTEDGWLYFRVRDR